MKARKCPRRIVGAAVETLEFRKLLAGSVTGVVFEDADGDGARDAGEVGISGRTVYADLNANFVADLDDPSTTTGSNGAYTLASLSAGPVNLVYQLPSGSDFTAPGLGLQRLIVVDSQAAMAVPFGSRQENTRQYLDPGFGTQGETVLSGVGTKAAVGIKQLASGGTVVVSMSNGAAMVTRFTAGGALDTSFGGGTGSVVPSLPAGFVVDSVAIMSDARLVLGGHGATINDLEVAVLRADGAADATFSGDGFQSVDFGGDESLRDVAVSPDNRIVLLGTGDVSEILLTRLNVSGTPDFDFGTDGKAQFDLNSSVDEPVAVAIQSDSKILVAGTRTFTSGRTSGLMLRLNSGGGADLTYASAGTRVIDVASASLRLTDMIVQSNNRALVAGELPLGLLYFSRLNTTGTTDSSFGDSGTRTYLPNLDGFPLTPTGIRLAVNSAGVIAFATQLSEGVLGGPTGTRIGLGMFNSLGMPEVNYLPGGDLTQGFTGAESDSAFGDLLIQSDNKIVIAGTAFSGVSAGNKIGVFRTAGLQPRASLSGNVFSDLNNNGVRDAGEPASAERIVYVDINGDGERASGEPFATTDAQGNYAISELLPDTYNLELSAPGGFVQSLPVNELPIELSLSPGQNLGGQNFGLHEVPPTIEANAGGPYTVGEGGTVQLLGNATGAPITVYEWDFDYDGITFTVDSTQQSPLFSATNLDGAGSRTLALRARSGSFPPSGISTATLTINNVAPTATISNNGPIGAGGVGTVTFGGQNDPSAADRAAGFKYSFDFGNDGVFEIIDSTSATATFPSAMTSLPGSAVVRGQIKDKDGGSNDYLSTLTINDSPPTPVGATIRGVVFLDVDRDGIRDAGEAGVAGRNIYLDNNNNSVKDAAEPQVSTGADGTYQFTGLSAGTYKIRQILPANFVQTTPADNFGNNATVSGTQIASGEDFGTAENVTPTGATIRGTMFLDVDRDGVFDAGESGVSGRTVYLDLDNDSVLDAGERSTTTGANGVYEFGGLAAGTYKIRQILPANFVQTTPANNFGNNATVSGTQTANGLNFGTAENVTPTGATIRGTVFLDADRDGNFDSGESGVAGRTVYLDLDNDSVLDSNERSTTTNASGVYEFGGLAAGTYKIRQVLPGGFIQTSPSNNFGNNATVSGTQVANGLNFGTNTSTAPTGGTIRGTVFNDVDRDGNFDTGESGVSGRTVYIDANNNGVRDTGEASAVTNSSGVYEIGGLSAGTYKVRQILPGGFSQTTPSNGFGNNVTLSTNQTTNGVNFGSAVNQSRVASSLTMLQKRDSLAQQVFGEEPIL